MRPAPATFGSSKSGVASVSHVGSGKASSSMNAISSPTVARMPMLRDIDRFRSGVVAAADVLPR
jgi:hypothetical protein